MKKRTLFRTLALMLAMIMLLSSFTVMLGAEEVQENEEQAAPENNAGSSEDKVLRDDCWYIAYKNITTYSIVRSKNAMNLVKAKLIEVQENFKKWTAADPTAKIDKEKDHLLWEDAGADLDLITNASQLTNQEIVVGQTGSIGRQEIEDRAAELGIGSADFFIEVKEDGDIWIIGGSNTATTVAVDFCIDRIFDVNIDERYICVKKGTFYVYYNEPTEARPEFEERGRGENGYEFTVSPNTMDDVLTRLSFAKLGGWRIQNKYSLTGDYDDYGASQLVALAAGELPDLSVETLTYEDVEGGVKVLAPDGSYAIVYAAPFKIEFYTASGKLVQTLTKLSYTIAAGGHPIGSVSLALTENEPIYGGGQKFDNVNQYGQKLVLYSMDVWDNNEGADSNWQSQIIVPLFTKLSGSGVFMNRNEYMIADIGKTDATTMKMDVTSGLIDFYVFTTETIAESIGKYCEVSGANALPEEWTYGMIVCRAYPDFSNLDKVYRIISKMDAYNLPWTGITIQGWNAYNNETHEELKTLCDHVHSLGKKVIVSVTVGDFPGASEMDAEIRAENELPADQKPEVPALNYFMEYKTSAGKKHSYVDSLGATVYDKKIPNCDPEMLSIGLLDSEKIQDNNTAKAGFYLDITDPEAVNWFFGEYWDYLTFDVGVDGIKIDGGFKLPDTAGSLTKIYDESVPLAGMHHWYPVAFTAMIWEKIAAKPDSGICFVRGAGIGAQRFSYVALADQTRIFNRLQRQVTAMITAGLSGIAFTSFDIGGAKYKDGSLAIGSDAPIFLRSLQIAAFSASMQVAGEGTRQPYDYAEYEEDGAHPYAYVTELYKIYTMVHEALTPYLNEQSEIAVETGMPVVRHLVLQYADDANVYDMKNQYMLGDAFLVAPVVPERIANNKARKIYLPEGEWLDLLSGETITVGEGGMEFTGYNNTKKGSLTQGQIPVFYNLNTTSKTAPEVYTEVQELLAMASAVEIP